MRAGPPIIDAEFTVVDSWTAKPPPLRGKAATLMARPKRAFFWSQVRKVALLLGSVYGLLFAIQYVIDQAR